MFDLGVYSEARLTGPIGPAKRVAVMSGIAIPERIVDNRRITVQTDDDCQLLIDFDDQGIGVVTTGFTLQMYRAPGIEIQGTEGTIQMLGEDWDPKGHELWRNGHGAWEVHELRGAWSWTNGIREALAAIQERRKPVNSPEHAHHVLGTMSKSAESARMGQSRPIASTFEPARFDAAPRAVAHPLDRAPS